MIWFLGDSHFGHRNIIKYCGRPWDHNKRILLGLQTCVGPDDILIHMGDVAWTGCGDYFDELPGKTKILIQGNHDKRSKVLKKPWDLIIKPDQQPLKTEWEGIDFYLAHDPKLNPHEFDSIFIHAHSHEKGVAYSWIGDNLAVHTSVEQHDYYPVSLSEILHVYRSQ